MTMAPEFSAHEAMQTKACARPSCIFDADPGSEYCGDHRRSRRLERGEVTAARLQLAARARELRDQGRSHNEIAAELGISRSYASELSLDPDGSQGRARKDRYRLPCPSCGEPMTGSNGITGAPERCAVCASAWQHEERYWTAEQIIDTFKRFHEIAARPPTASDSQLMHGANSLRVKCSPARLDEADMLARQITLPHPASVYREFGTWRAALEAAGYPGQGLTGGAAHRGPAKRGRRLGSSQTIVLDLLQAGPSSPGALETGTPALAGQADRVLRSLIDRGLVEKVGRGVYAVTGADPTQPDEGGGTAVARTFVVFARNGVGWVPRQTVDAITADLAIEQVATEEGEYVAVEERHWQPCTVAPVTRLAVVKTEKPEPQPA